MSLLAGPLSATNLVMDPITFPSAPGVIASRPAHSRAAWVAVSTAAAVVACLDGCEIVLYCCFFLRVPPRALFLFIASALLGPKTATALGWPAVALGVALHVCVAFGVAGTFFLLTRKFPALLAVPALSGPVFGVAVFGLMHYLVVPLTAVPRSHPGSWQRELINGLFSHIFMVGLPIALIFSCFERRTNPRFRRPTSRSH